MSQIAPTPNNPSFSNDNGNLSIHVEFIGPNWGLSPASINIGVNVTGAYLTITTNIVSVANPSNSFTLPVNIVDYTNALPIEIIINDTIGAQCFDKKIGAVVNLPPRTVGSTSGVVAQEVENILFRLELEAITILDNVLKSFSNHYQRTFKTEIPREYTEFVQHIENAQNSLKSVIEVIKE